MSLISNTKSAKRTDAVPSGTVAAGEEEQDPPVERGVQATQAPTRQPLARFSTVLIVLGGLAGSPNCFFSLPKSGKRITMHCSPKSSNLP